MKILFLMSILLVFSFAYAAPKKAGTVTNGKDPCGRNIMGDGFCDMAINNEECQYDGGDCCNSAKPDWDKRCRKKQPCQCLQGPPPTPPTSGDCTCGQQNAFHRIVGGEDATAGEFPYQAMLLNNKGTFICGGTIISTCHVLTAAHCTGFNGLQVKLGEHDRSSAADNAKVIKVRKVTEHPDYSSSTYNNDFSILTLDEPIDFNYYIQSACLPEDPTEDYAGTNASVTGWGTVSSGGALPNILQEVVVPVLSNDQCTDGENGNYSSTEITDSMLCAGKTGKDACQGDSGGPMVNFEKGFGEVIGVVSWGYGCALEGYPGVYGRVTHQLDWILKTIASDDQCSLCARPSP